MLSQQEQAKSIAQIADQLQLIQKTLEAMANVISEAIRQSAAVRH